MTGGSVMQRDGDEVGPRLPDLSEDARQYALARLSDDELFGVQDLTKREFQALLRKKLH